MTQTRPIPAILAFLCACSHAPQGPPSPQPSENTPSPYWETPRAGANAFNLRPTAGRYEAAAAIGLDFIRLAPNKWASEGRDFLIGDADRFDGIPATDLNRLRNALDQAHAAGLKVVLTILSLPGARWRSHNDDEDDSRLWTDRTFHEQSAAFWRELASALRGHPAIAAYNPLNEPHPEALRADGQSDDAWHRAIEGTAADANVLYRTLVNAIRSVDAHTPIVLDAAAYASPSAFPWLEPVDDPNVLYAFHFYHPWRHTTWRQNQGRTTYPSADWNRETLAAAMAPVRAWQQRHGLPASRILMAEFGCDRRVPGADAYLGDTIALAQEQGWHWAFYAFREDEWDGMDYELGTEPLPWRIREARDQGQPVTLPRQPNPLFQVLVDGIATQRDQRLAPTP